MLSRLKSRFIFFLYRDLYRVWICNPIATDNCRYPIKNVKCRFKSSTWTKTVLYSLFKVEEDFSETDHRNRHPELSYYRWKFSIFWGCSTTLLIFHSRWSLLWIKIVPLAIFQSLLYYALIGYFRQLRSGKQANFCIFEVQKYEEAQEYEEVQEYEVPSSMRSTQKYRSSLVPPCNYDRISLPKDIFFMTS